MDWLDTLDPGEWVLAMDQAVRTLPFWIVIILVVCLAIRFSVVPFIKACKGKK